MANKLKSLPWSFWIVGGGLLFIFLTILGPSTPDSIRYSILHHFDLAIENNLGNWWSAMNFLLLALLAYELFSARVDRNKTAWLILAGIYAFLSIDELGSIHERLKFWSILLPVAALIGLAYLYVLYRLLSNHATRSLALWVVVGSAFMASVALQEFMEHRLLWPDWAVGIRTGVEEGTELLGAFLILRQLIRYRLEKGLISDTTLEAVIPDPFRMVRLASLLVAGLILHSLVSLVVVFRAEQSNLGNPSVWYIAALFFVLFCAAFWMFNAYVEKRTGWFWAAQSILFLLNSALIIYLILPRPVGSRIYSLGLLASAYFIFALQSLLILLGFLAIDRDRARPKIVALGGLTLALLLASQVQGMALEFIMIGIYACALAFICFPGMETNQASASIAQESRRGSKFT